MKNTDLALWNYIASEIVYNKPEAIDWDFVKEHIVFAASPVNIGYGMRKSDEKSIKDGKYSKAEMEIISKEMEKVDTDTGSAHLHGLIHDFTNFQ